MIPLPAAPPWRAKLPATVNDALSSCGLPELSFELELRLVREASGYLYANQLEKDDFEPASRLNTKKMLALVQKHAVGLADAIGALDGPTSQALDLPQVTIPDLDELALRANTLARAMKGRGPVKHRARRQLVSELANLFEEATGTPPTRRHNPETGEDYGPFRDVVMAVLKCIDPGGSRGVDHDIRAVLKKRPGDAREKSS